MSHEAIDAELTRMAKTNLRPSFVSVVDGGPEAEEPRWEAVSAQPDTPFLALKPNCAVTRVAHASDIRDPGVRAFNLPLRLMAFLSAAEVPAKSEFEAMYSQCSPRRGRVSHSPVQFTLASSSCSRKYKLPSLRVDP